MHLLVSEKLYNFKLNNLVYANILSLKEKNVISVHFHLFRGKKRTKKYDVFVYVKANKRMKVHEFFKYGRIINVIYDNIFCN